MLMPRSWSFGDCGCVGCLHLLLGGFLFHSLLDLVRRGGSGGPGAAWWLSTAPSSLRWSISAILAPLEVGLSDPAETRSWKRSGASPFSVGRKKWLAASFSETGTALFANYGHGAGNVVVHHDQVGEDLSEFLKSVLEVAQR